MTFLAIFKMQQPISISSEISASGGIYCIDGSTVRRYTVGVCGSTLVMEGAFYTGSVLSRVTSQTVIEWRLNKYAENCPEQGAAKLFISVLTLTTHQSSCSRPRQFGTGPSVSFLQFCCPTLILTRKGREVLSDLNQF